MKNSFLTALVILLPLILISCDDADDISSVVGGRCYISNLSEDILCIKFANNSDTNSNSNYCTTERVRYADSNGATGSEFLAGNANNCDSSNTVGTCIVSSNVFNYYSPEFDASSAETDCTGTQGGSWSP